MADPHEEHEYLSREYPDLAEAVPDFQDKAQGLRGVVSLRRLAQSTADTHVISPRKLIRALRALRHK